MDRAYKCDPNIDLDDFIQAKIQGIYASLKNECRSGLLEYQNYGLLTRSDYIQYVKLYQDNVQPLVQVCVTLLYDFSLQIMVHGIELPSSHSIWSRIKQKITKLCDIKNVLQVLSCYSLCPGNPDQAFQTLHNNFDSSKRRAAYLDKLGQLTIRARNCCFLIEHFRCKQCICYRRTLSKAMSRQKTKIATPKKNWVKSTNPNSRLTLSQKLEKLKQLRSYSLKLENEVDRLKKKVRQSFETDSIQLAEADNLDFGKIMDQSEKEIFKTYPDESSLERLFWEQQKYYNCLANKRNMKWHPMIIKWCILLKSKSSSTYDAVRKAGFIHLPSERTLQDYTNILTRDTGFHEDVICQLHQETSSFTETHQKIVGILQDEIKIRSNLVYDKYTGQLIGFVDLDKTGNSLKNISKQLGKEDKSLARYVLVVMVRGLSTTLKYPLAHFATNGVVSDQLFPILWEAVEILEVDLNLVVLFITSDGASPNRRFIRLHGGAERACIYKTENIFAEEKRPIYFISDPPHLLKTARNNFSNSYSHNKTKKLWKSGQDISWMHVVDLFKEHCNGVYRLCPKLTKQHVNLTSYGYMKVNLAAQVLSTTVANALELVYKENTLETVKFIRHMNKFFDIMNTRNFKEASKKKNDNLKPFTAVDDPRLAYLTEEFLPYFTDWQREVEARPGNFTRAQRSAMLPSYQTIEGLKITVQSVVECVIYCLNKGMPFVLTEKFNQDAIEQHFGCHRASGGSNSNPSLHQFNSSMQKLRVIGSQALAPLRGNTKRQLHMHVDSTPLPKKPRL